MSQGSVIDFNQARTQKLEEKRRKTERIFFKQILGVYCVVEHQGSSELKSLEPVDISEDGFSFQIPFHKQADWPDTNSEFTVRLYFTKDTYLPVVMKVVNSKPTIEDGIRYTRYGCQVDQSISSYPVYQQFVKFLRGYSEHAHQDKGDITLFYL
jgi:hypothetical protein